FVSRSGHSLSSRMCQHFLVFIFAQYSVPPHIYALSLHDALPICSGLMRGELHALPRDRVARAEYSRALGRAPAQPVELGRERRADRKSTRLNSSHVKSSYAVFCLKKKTQATVWGSEAAHRSDTRP